MKLATDVDRAVLAGLSNELELTEDARAKAARALATRLMKDKKALDVDYKKKLSEKKRYGMEIGKAITNRWPEMSNRWNPRVQEMLTSDSATLI